MNVLRTGHKGLGRGCSIFYTIRLGDVFHVAWKIDSRITNGGSIIRDSRLGHRIIKQDWETEDSAGERFEIGGNRLLQCNESSQKILLCDPQRVELNVVG